MSSDPYWQYQRRFLKSAEPPAHPARVGDLLGRVLKDFAPTTRSVGSEGEHQRLEDLQEKWTQVVGGELAGLTRIVRYRQGVLTVKVDSSPLRAELQGFARDKLLEDLNALGLRGVHDLRFC